MNRRRFFKYTIGGVTTLLGYAWQVEPFWVEFVHRKMPIKNLPPNLEGKMLMQISDIHIGNRFNYQYIIDSFKKAQAYNPDIVVYTGDYVSYNNAQQLEQLEEVFAHRVKGSIGTIGILGNHDYGKNWGDSNVAAQITQILQSKDITILRNERTELQGLRLIGFDDYWGTNFNPEKVMQGYDNSKANIVLCHNPDVCDLDIWQGYKGWILAGHTHGGQCKPPFLPAPMLPVKNKRYSAGEIPLKDGRTLYINRALGCLWQVRFNVRPEITIFALQEES